MPIKIGWLIENRISYFKYIGDVTVKEMTKASDIGLEFLHQSPAPLVHTLQDASEMTTFPKRVGAVLTAVRKSLSDPKMGWMISYGVQNDAVRYVAIFVSKILNTRYRLLPDLPSALEFLTYVDTTLPDLSDIQPLTEDDYEHIVDASIEEKLPSS